MQFFVTQVRCRVASAGHQRSHSLVAVIISSVPLPPFHSHPIHLTVLHLCPVVIPVNLQLLNVYFIISVVRGDMYVYVMSGTAVQAQFGPQNFVFWRNFMSHTNGTSAALVDQGLHLL